MTRRLVVALVVLCGASVGTALLYNNVSLAPSSRREFGNRLDKAIGHGTDWVVKQYHANGSEMAGTPEGRMLMANAPTAHMMVDCAALSGESRLAEVASAFRAAWRENGSALGKVVDPSMPTHPLSVSEFDSLDEYQHWILYGASPDLVRLPPEELSSLFSPDRHRTGKATHQLLALYFYRKSKGATPELDRLMDKVAERIAGEATLDFRVTDLYLQRIAFLLAAGRPDLVRRRWVERALEAQQDDGGWLDTWYGWTRTPRRFSFGHQSTSHATAQAMWIACMLKFRYPEWIKDNHR